MHVKWYLNWSITICQWLVDVESPINIEVRYSDWFQQYTRTGNLQSTSTFKSLNPPLRSEDVHEVMFQLINTICQWLLDIESQINIKVRHSNSFQQYTRTDNLQNTSTFKSLKPPLRSEDAYEVIFQLISYIMPLTCWHWITNYYCSTPLRFIATVY